MLDYENQCIINGYKSICGVDEAGRGPLAGDVFAAAVIMPEGKIIAGVNDSKKVSEKKREQLFDEICKESVSFCIASASVEEIENTDILKAALLAMKRAVEGLSVPADFALIDGNQRPNLNIDCMTVIKGDSLSHSIAAASILAKVSRDRYMLGLDKEYPQYKFAVHKGYGTKLHSDLIKEFGASPVHRSKFLRKILEKPND